MNQLKTVFVLGAGFTKAFLPDAPLLVDDYNGNALLDKFQQFKYAYDLLQSELDSHDGKQMDLERLMSRLDGGMPYDLSLGPAEELRLLLSSIKKSFKDRLKNAKESGFGTEQQRIALAKFATYCLDKQISCITFNYDDILDQRLWQISKFRDNASEYPWNPDSGYGFLCQAAERPTFTNIPGAMLTTSMLLLKLHGSITWYSKLGYSPPYNIDAIVHSEEWSSSEGVSSQDKEKITLHLETDPFIVPPVLVKSALVEQPILRLVWSLAYRKLQQAEQVVFVGYSLPVTDIAARFLFHEAIRPDAQVRVVNWASQEEQKQETRMAYRRIFPKLTDEQFDFRGAEVWSEELLHELKQIDPEALDI